MKKNSRIAAFIVCALLIPIFVVQAQFQSSPSNRSTISGFVFDGERRPVSDVEVELLNDVGSVLQRTKTSGSGRFFFSGLSQGRFSIRVIPLRTNFEEQTQDVEIYGIGVGGRALADNLQKDIYLRARRDSNAVPIGKGAIFVQDVPQEAKQIYATAISDLERNRLAEGIAQLENALRIFPTYYLALEKLGIIYLNLRKLDKAVEMLSRAVAVNSRSFGGWYGLAYANYAMRQSVDAVDAADKAVSLNSSSVDAVLLLGMSQRQARQYEEAEKSLKQADKLTKGQSADVHWNLALLYAHNLKRYNDAANELELYLKINPDIPNKDNVKKLIKKFRENPNPSN